GSLIDRVASLDRKVRECMRQMSAHPGDVGQHPSELLVLLQIDASSAQIDDVLEQRLYQPRAQAGLELGCKKPHDSAFERTAVVEPGDLIVVRQSPRQYLQKRSRQTFAFSSHATHEETHERVVAQLIELASTQPVPSR